MDKPQANNSRKIERLKQILISSELLQSWLSSEKKKKELTNLKLMKDGLSFLKYRW